MAETLFSFDKKNFRECQQLYRGPRDQEYYLGDYSIEDSGVIDVRAERKTVGPLSVILLRSATRLFFRRTARHIREDGIDLSVLWFVKRGRLAFSNQHGCSVAAPGDFLITRSTSPFFIECRPEGDAHEVLHATVPTHVLRSHLGCDLGASLFMPAGRREASIAESILTDVFKDEGVLAEGVARALIEAALTVIGHAIRAEAAAPVRATVAERRLEDVLRFIEVHLSDPGLSTAMVASGCGISPRYLSFLLRLKGTTFSQLVWRRRLEQAKSWLGASERKNVSISEVAYGVGFKSPAHFSRMFRRVFKMSPREFRMGHDETQQDFERYADGGGLLQ